MDFTCALFFVAILAGFQTEVSSSSYDKNSKKHLIYWDSTISESIKDLSYSIHVEMRQFLDIICPYTPLGDNAVIPVSFDIYNVTKDGYETCNAKGGRLIFNCDRPEQENKLTIKFQRISPSPFGFRFQECSDYYFLAVKRTDNKYNKFNKLGCNEKSERLRIQVGCPDDKKPTPTTTHKPKTSFVDRILKEKIEKENKKPVIPDIIPVTNEPKTENKKVSAASKTDKSGNSSTKSAHLNVFLTLPAAAIASFYILLLSA